MDVPDAGDDTPAGSPRGVVRIDVERDTDPPGVSPSVTLRLTGELDLASAPAVDAAVGEQLAAGVRELVVDAAGLTFVDSAGLRALLFARRDADAAGARLRVQHPSESLRRVFALSGVEHVFLDPDDA